LPGRGENFDDCDVCGEGGNLLCCDGCPLAIHFECLDPPLTEEQFEEDFGDQKWYCNACLSKKVTSLHFSVTMD